MTPEAFVTLVNERMSVGFPFKAWGVLLRATHEERERFVNVRVTMSRTPHRDTGHAGAVAQLCSLDVLLLERWGDRDAADYIRRHLLLELARHEMDESILIDGVRAFDPHREDAP